MLPKSQNDDSFLQPCYHILAVLKGGLLEAQKTLEFHNTSLEEKMFLQMTIDPIMGRLPLSREDAIVLHYCLLNPVCSQQALLTTLLGVCFNLTDLGPMSPPFPFHIIHLKERDQYGHQEALHPFLTLDSNFIIWGNVWRYMAVECWIAWVAWCKEPEPTHLSVTVM